MKKNGKRCGMYPLRGEELCVSHSQSDKAKRSREYGKYMKYHTPKTVYGRLHTLQEQLKLVKKSTTISEKSRGYLIIALLDKIAYYQEKIGEFSENP